MTPYLLNHNERSNRMSNIDIINGMFVYKPTPEKQEYISESTYTYNGVVLPPIPGCTPTC